MRTALFIRLITIAILLSAIENCKGASIGGSGSIYHSPGSKGIFLEYRPNRVGVGFHYWTGSKSQDEPNNAAISIDYAMPLSENWGFIGGLCYLKEKSKQTGTHVNACLGFEWSGKEVFVRLWHASHGASFGISGDRANSGYNFLIIGRRF